MYDIRNADPVHGALSSEYADLLAFTSSPAIGAQKPLKYKIQVTEVSANTRRTLVDCTTKVSGVIVDGHASINQFLAIHPHRKFGVRALYNTSVVCTTANKGATYPLTTKGSSMGGDDLDGVPSGLTMLMYISAYKSAICTGKRVMRLPRESLFWKALVTNMAVVHGEFVPACEFSSGVPGYPFSNQLRFCAKTARLKRLRKDTKGTTINNRGVVVFGKTAGSKEPQTRPNKFNLTGPPPVDPYCIKDVLKASLFGRAMYTILQNQSQR